MSMSSLSRRTIALAIASGVSVLGMALTSCSTIDEALSNIEATTSSSRTGPEGPERADSSSRAEDASRVGAQGSEILGSDGLDSGDRLPFGRGEVNTATPQPGAMQESLSPTPEEREVMPQYAQQQSERRIYHSSQGWEFLENPDYVFPGGRYIVESSTGESHECSFGWWVFDQSQSDRHFILTAGHCGNEGDNVYIENSAGEIVQVGQFVWSNFQENGDAPIDYALIELTIGTEYVSGTPPLEDMELAGYADGSWLEQENPYICRLGFRTGLSCGQFRQLNSNYTFAYDGIVDHGDSGGPVYAIDPEDSSKMYAVGVTSFTFADDATNSGAAIVAPMMEEFGFTIAN